MLSGPLSPHLELRDKVEVSTAQLFFSCLLVMCLFTLLGPQTDITHFLSVFYRELDLSKQFQEEAHSVALHPTGLFVLVGFSDKLRLMNLLVDDIRVFQEFTVRSCREVCSACFLCTYMLHTA